jgi:hypothetical protein
MTLALAFSICAWPSLMQTMGAYKGENFVLILYIYIYVCVCVNLS